MLRKLGETGEKLPRPGAEEMFDTVAFHAKMMLQYKGEYTAVREMRKHLSWYSAGMPGSAAMRGRINEMVTMEDIIATAAELFGCKDRLKRDCLI